MNTSKRQTMKVDRRGKKHGDSIRMGGTEKKSYGVFGWGQPEKPVVGASLEELERRLAAITPKLT